VCIKGNYGNYIGATPSMGATCKSNNPGREETVDVVTNNDNTVSLKSRFGRYLYGEFFYFFFLYLKEILTILIAYNFD
jgi:hypothetical protein